MLVTFLVTIDVHCMDKNISSFVFIRRKKYEKLLLRVEKLNKHTAEQLIKVKNAARVLEFCVFFGSSSIC